MWTTSTPCRAGLTAALTLVAVASVAWAADGQTVESLRAELDAMRQRMAQQDQKLASQEAQITRLRDQVGDNWLDQARKEQVVALIKEVLADADTRASLLESSIVAGYDNGFFLASADGNNRLTFKGQIQVRYTHGFQNNSSDATSADAIPDDSRGGFGESRTRFGFAGHVVDPTWTFLIWAGYDCTGRATLLDAYVTKNLGDGWSVTAGQFKLPFMLEYLISETSLQFVDRTLLAGQFCGTYTQGVMVTYQNDWFRGRGSFNDGASAINTIWHARDNDYGLTGRAEFKLAGKWSDYANWQGWRGQEPLVVLGAAMHVQETEYGSASTHINGAAADDIEVFNARWTIDLSIELSGLNLFVAGLGSHSDNAVALDQYGFIVQVGWFATDKLELIGRYEWSDSDVVDEDPLSIVTMGFNYFFAQHRLKWTTDVGIALEPVGGSFDAAPLGWRVDSGADAHQVVVRSQLQLLF